MAYLNISIILTAILRCTTNLVKGWPQNYHHSPPCHRLSCCASYDKVWFLICSCHNILFKASKLHISKGQIPGFLHGRERWAALLHRSRKSKGNENSNIRQKKRFPEYGLVESAWLMFTFLRFEREKKPSAVDFVFLNDIYGSFFRVPKW